LRCLVSYGRLCSKVWLAFPCFGAAFRNISEDQVSYLDFEIKRWLDSIPQSLRFVHPRLGSETQNQDRIHQQLRTLLYLRGNQMRTLLHRHHVLSCASISNNTAAAGIVVDTAKDTIQVLVHLHESSDIYMRQQVTFNYFLISALSAIFLAVCHAPALYSSQCRDTFYNAIELLRGFAKISTASRRLWESVKGLLPGARTLGLDRSKEQQMSKPTSNFPTSKTHVVRHESDGSRTLMEGSHETLVPNQQPVEASAVLDASLTDIYQMSEDLASFYEVFVQGGGGEFDMGNDSSALFAGDSDEVSRSFRGFI
jgi:hypothetical protein